MSATKQYRQSHPHQPFLFPPSPHDRLDEGDLAYFILDVVTVLDLGAIEAAIHAKDARGTRPYDPRMMTALLMSYDRMLKAESELREEIEQLLLLAEQTDQEEDARYGRGKRGDEIPEELRCYQPAAGPATPSAAGRAEPGEPRGLSRQALG